MKLLTIAFFQEFFFRLCVKKAVGALLLCLSLTYSRSLHQEMTYFLVLYLFYKEVYPMPSVILCYSYLEKTQEYHLGSMGLSCPVFTVVEVHSSTLRSTGRQFIFLKCEGLCDHEAAAQDKNICTCFEPFAIQFLRPYSQEIDHDVHPQSKCACIRALQSNLLEE